MSEKSKKKMYKRCYFLKFSMGGPCFKTYFICKICEEFYKNDLAKRTDL